MLSIYVEGAEISVKAPLYVWILRRDPLLT